MKCLKVLCLLALLSLAGLGQATGQFNRGTPKWKISDGNYAGLAYPGDVPGKTFVTLGDHELRISAGDSQLHYYTLNIAAVGKNGCRITREVQDSVVGQNPVIGGYNYQGEKPDRKRLNEFRKWKHLLRFAEQERQKMFERLSKCVP